MSIISDKPGKMEKQVLSQKTTGGKPGKRFPYWYWLLPVFFLLIGGIVAAYLAHKKYHATWWDLPVLGLLVTIAVYMLIGMIIVSLSP
jgi:hypothetical protein